METLYLIDGSSYIYRAFYALGRFSNSKGLPTQAVYGFATMLAKVMREQKPDYVCVAFDAPGPTFRHEQFPDYKATRQSMPEDLIVQVPYIKQLVKLHGIPHLEIQGYEADDLIATLTLQAVQAGLEVVIVSGDKDLFQLIHDPAVRQWDPQRDRLFTEAAVEEKTGVQPSQVRDYLALLGDSSDNVPGVRGVGEKTARQLIRQWGSLESIFSHLDEIASAAVRRKLEEGRESAFLSRELVTLEKQAPVQIQMEALRPRTMDVAALKELYGELEFRSLLETLPDTPDSAPSTATTSPDDAQQIVRVHSGVEGGTVEMLQSLHGPRPVPVQTFAKPGPPMRSPLLGLAFSALNGEVGYVDLADPSASSSDGEESVRLRDALSEFLADPAIPKAGEDLKSAWILLRRHGYRLDGLGFDTMVAGYLLDAGGQSRSLEHLAAEYAPSASKIRFELPSDQPGLKLPPEAPCRTVALVERIVPVLRSKLFDAGLAKLFDTVEMPLVSILAEMEHHGILLDGGKLQLLAQDFQEELDKKKAVIYDLAKEEFNIQSPKQLAGILFDKLGLRVIKKTKSGPSTDMSVLEELALEHPLPEQILAYRSLAKLKSTYVDTLPDLIHPETGRIHTSFNQTVTATGRLSSSDPNLQNIPVRSREGLKIRAAFTAAPGCLLLSADYSQIELRILAHYSQDEHLMEAFRTGLVVHRHTAAEMLNIPPLEVTPEMRRQAKMINFGIIYGMSPFGLAQRLRIPSKLAKSAIDRYFDRYRGVRAFIDETIRKTRAAGACETLLGRRRLIPEIQSRNRTIQQQGERLAVNTPIQGTAADLIKKAMIDIAAALKRERMNTAMILQVHDELVFEAPEKELEAVRELIRDRMENVWPLAVPLKVDMGWGHDWAEAHP